MNSNIKRSKHLWKLSNIKIIIFGSGENKIIAFVSVVVILIYKPIMIRLTVKRYLTNNNIKNYYIVKIEKYPAQDGYLVQLKNDLKDYRNLTIISEKMPIDVIHDSRLDKEDMQ